MNEKRIYTVSEITRRVRDVLENSIPEVWVEGEISNLRRPASGHIYFTLKDEHAQLRAVFFWGQAQNLNFELEDGLKVVAFGKIGVYEKRGEYQLYVETLEPRGIGALQLAFEQLKRKLEKEGLFDLAHKKSLPPFPRRIGIVTSPTGAAIRDILRIILRRFPKLEILLYPVKVQGEGAAEEIAQAIYDFNRLEGIDVLIVGRGGGSIEDLWAFNQEIVARSIYHSRIPIISAVGHEIDFVISDFVADLRAPTPSAAAELVVGLMEEVIQSLDVASQRMEQALYGIIQMKRKQLENLTSRYILRHPEERIRQLHLQLDELGGRMERGYQHLVELKGEFLRGLAGKLNALSPLSILSRGYSITVLLPQREVIKEVKKVKPGDKVEVRVHRGEMTCQVEEVKG